jgi:hypothetical protein
MADDKVNQNKNENNKSLLTRLSNFISGGAFANGLAIFLIAGSLIAIIWLVWVHQDTISDNRDLYEKIINNTNKYSPKTDDILDSFQIFYRESNAANTNMLSILLPVFGAWVGAIIAFYYGNKNFEKLSQGYRDAVDVISTSITDSTKLSILKAGEILEKNPEYKKVSQAKISDQVGNSFKDIGPAFLLKDDENKPLGFIYREDILIKVKITEDDLQKVTDNFKDFFKKKKEENNPIIDEITGKMWTETGLENNLKNYIELNLSDTLLTARDKMRVLSEKQKVRCLVLDNQRQITGIITYDLIAKAQSDQIEEKVIK